MASSVYRRDVEQHQSDEIFRKTPNVRRFGLPASKKGKPKVKAEANIPYSYHHSDKGFLVRQQLLPLYRWPAQFRKRLGG
jgi:hypothetical protein